MRDKYQQDGVGLGPLYELVYLNFNWTLQALKKHLYHVYVMYVICIYVLHNM